MKVAVYARVSTSDKGQDPELQLEPMREYCRGMGWWFDEFIDHASGAKESRPALDRLTQRLKRREYDMLMVWKLDRLARSLRQLIHIVYDELRTRNIGFKCLTQDFDTTTPTGTLVFNVLGALSEFEHDLHSERITEGMKLAKSKGKRLGRKKALDEDTARLLKEEYERNGHKIRAAARTLNIPPGTAHGYLKGE